MSAAVCLNDTLRVLGERDEARDRAQDAEVHLLRVAYALDLADIGTVPTPGDTAALVRGWLADR